jgi:hypothetical protein
MSESFLQTTAKSKLYIGPASNTISALDEFEAIDESQWTEITGLIDLGKWGAKGNEITQGLIEDAFVHRLKGNIDNGSMEVVLARNPFDAGQNILKSAAQANWNKYAIRVVLNDQPTDTGTPSTFYFRGVPMAFEGDFGEVNNVVKVNATIGIDGQLFEVPADVTVAWSPAGSPPIAGVGVLTYADIPANSETVTVGNRTYTFKSALTPAANEVLIGASADASYTNLKDAINGTGTPGVAYAAATLVNTDVSAAIDTADETVTVTSKATGSAVNSIATTATTGDATWGNTHLTGGADSVVGALPSATTAVAYSTTVAASGGLGTPSYSISGGALPSGITLNSATGVISGTHTGTGSFAFTVKVTYDGFGEDEAAYTLAVA